MKIKKPEFYLDEYDQKFFNYLHEVKVALYQQIARDVPKYEIMKSLYTRIRKFEILGFLSGVYSSSYLKRKIVCLTTLGFERFVSNGDERRVELKSYAIDHDIDLVDIRHFLKKSPKIKSYYTENSLQTWGDLIDSDKYRPFVDMRSDAAVEISFPNGNFLVALEYEMVRKFYKRYGDMFRRYYSCNQIPAVLYVCQTEKIMKKIMEKEKKECIKGNPKFYYKTFDDLKNDPNLIFTNRKGGRIELGTT